MAVRKKKGKERTKIAVIILATAVILTAVFLFLEKRYTIKTIYVEGNVHYTQKEIIDMVTKGSLGHNSLYLSVKYRKKGVENIPFVDVMDVQILSPDTIKIVVYEKALAGYVRYMDTYMYFDKDGYVVECSDVKTQGIPQITGLKFGYMVLGERLPIEDEGCFTNIMDITKLLKKYSLEADKIYFHSSGEVTIYFGNVKAALGKVNRHLEDKMMRLPKLLEKAGDRSGTLRMENLTEDNTNVTFELEE